jgi:predicted dehydrogenase
MKTKSQKNFGIVGYGNIGKRHAAIIPEFGILKSICEPNVSKRSMAQSNTSATCYDELNVMLKQEPDLDIVVICTPNGLHSYQSILALEKGKHVICEKPMALNTIDCHKMKSASIEYGAQLFIVKQNRFNPLILLLKELCDEGYLGEIYSVQINCFWNRNSQYFKSSWRGTKSLDGGILFTQFSHFIDLIIWILGAPFSVKGYAKNFNHTASVESEDSGVVIMNFKDGPIAGIHYSINAFEKNLEGSILIIGSKGTIKIGGEYLNKLEYLLLEDKHKQERILKHDFLKLSNQDKLLNHRLFYAFVLRELSLSSRNLSNLEDSIKTVSLIEKINLSFSLT